MLSENQRQQLLRIARSSIATVLDGSAPQVDASDFHDDLHRPAGTFVTLKTVEGDLRGCIGSIRAVEPLYRSVISGAINAAFRDPRFRPVRKHELDDLRIEISVLGPIETVTAHEEVRVGHDGLIVTRGRYAGLLLPQVATEYGWDRLTFLEQTCVKAGLPRDAWRAADTRIERFAAEIFSEAELANCE